MLRLCFLHAAKAFSKLFYTFPEVHLLKNVTTIHFNLFEKLS